MRRVNARGPGGMLNAAVLSLAWLAAAGVGAALAAEPAAESSAVGSMLAISFPERHEVGLFDVDGTRLARIPTGLSPRGMAAREGKLYVANRGRNESPGSSLTVIDLKELRAVRTIYACMACAPYDLTFDLEGTLWFTGQADRTVYRMTAPYADGPEGSTVVAWGWPGDVARVEGMGQLAVSMRGTQQMALVDARTKRAERLQVGLTPVTVASRPGRPEVWVALHPMGKLNRVTVHGDAGDPTMELIDVEDFISAFAFLPDGGRLLLAAGQAPSLSLIDAESGKALTRMPLSSRGAAVVPSPDGSRAAVLLPGEGRVLLAAISPDGELSEESTFEVEGKPLRMEWLAEY